MALPWVDIARAVWQPFPKEGSPEAPQGASVICTTGGEMSITLTFTTQEIKTLKLALRAEILLTEEDQHFFMLNLEEEKEIEAVQRRRAARTLLRKINQIGRR